MPNYIFLYAKMVDAFNKEFSKTFELRDTTFAQAEIDAPGVLTDLGNLIGGRILGYNLTGQYTYTDTVDVGANVDEGVTLSVRKANNKKGALKFQTPIKADYVNPDRSVDMLDAAITAWLANFTGASSILLMSDGEHITEGLSGKLDV